MIDLDKTIKNSGLRQTYLADYYGVSKQTITNHKKQDSLSNFVNRSYIDFFEKRGLMVFYK